MMKSRSQKYTEKQKDVEGKQSVSGVLIIFCSVFFFLVCFFLTSTYVSVTVFFQYADLLLKIPYWSTFMDFRFGLRRLTLMDLC